MAVLALIAPRVSASLVQVFYDPTDGSQQAYFGGDGVATGTDIVGPEEDFDVLSMTVTQSGTNLQVDIVTRFIEGVYPNIGYGDLLIGTGGWNPTGSAAYEQDTASTSGTVWNYAVRTSGAEQGYLYKDAVLANSSDAAVIQDGDFRHDQYIRYASGGVHTATGTVVIDHPLLPNVLDSSSIDSEGTTLRYSLSLLDLGLLPKDSAQLALRWTMSCANDIVEAGFNVQMPSDVPEPTIVPLWLAGWAAWRLGRRRVESVRSRSEFLHSALRGEGWKS